MLRDSPEGSNGRDLDEFEHGGTLKFGVTSIPVVSRLLAFLRGDAGEDHSASCLQQSEPHDREEGTHQREEQPLHDPPSFPIGEVA